MQITVILSIAYFISLSLLNYAMPLTGSSFLLTLPVGLLSFLLVGRIASNRAFFIICFFTTAAFFFRPELYLDWDEWYMLDHLMKNGAAGLLHSHNEHFLPLFFGFYFLEILAFGTWYSGYLIISYVLHAINATLLRTFLLKLIPGVDRKIATGFSFLWLISSLHSEVLQWAFTQAVSLSTVFLLLSLVFGLRYLNEGRKRDCAIAVVSGGISPLCFGNGFAVIGYLFFLALLWLAQHPLQKSAVVKRSFVLLAAILLALLAVAVSYWHYRHGAGHGIDTGNSDLHLRGIINYLFVGWGLAIILRGLGFYPDISLQFIPGYLPHDCLTTLTSPQLALIYLVVAVAILLPTFFFLKKKYFNLFLFGNVIIILSYLLPAIRRYHLGLVQSLSLRYSYISLVGLVILLLPLVLRISEKFNRKQMLLKIAAALCFLSYLTVHLYMGSRYDYFAKRGVANKKFVVALEKWQEDLCSLGSSMKISYEGASTKLAGKYPIMPPSFTPGRHPIEIYQVLLWLDSSLPDLDCKREESE